MKKAFIEMNKRKVRHMAVTENGRYVGVLPMKDFTNYYLSRAIKKKWIL